LTDAQRVKYLSRISSLEKKVGQHEHQIVALQSMLFAAVRQFETDMARLGPELKAVHDRKNSHSPCPMAAAVVVLQNAPVTSSATVVL
jgi:hypothetical protein